MKIKNRYIILLLCLLMISVYAEGKDEKEPSHILYFSEFWKGEQDATPAMLTIMEAAKKQQNVTIIIESGEYHFYPEKAFEKYCYIPNHDNGLKRTAMPVLNMQNLTIKGEGAHFVYHGVMVPFIIEHSHNIHLQGVSIDWQLPLHTEVKVVANDVKSKSFDVEIPANQPYLLRNGELIFLKEGFEHNMETGILFDQQKQRVYYNTRAYTPIPYKNKVKVRHEAAITPVYEPFMAYPSMMKEDLQIRLQAKELKPGLVRISGSPKTLPPVGTIYACKGQGGINRLAPAIYINRSSNLSLNGMKIYHAGGMGIIAEGCENVTMNHLTIGVAPGSGRMVSTTADATHFLNCRGKISFDGCAFANQLDDATNVHGGYMVIEDVLNTNTLGVRVGHFQQQGLYFADKGDRIALVDQQKSVHAFHENLLDEVEVVNPGYYKLHFKNELPTHVERGMVVENLDAYPEVVVTNSRFENNRARGVLLSTPKKVVVENNYFSNMMSAVLMPVELSYWYESGHSQDVIIRNNEFVDCAYGGKDFPVINIHTSLDHSDYVFGTIVIENNTFRQFDAAIVKANGVANLQFNGNGIQSTSTYPPLFPDNSAIDIEHIGEFSATGNTFNGAARNKLASEEIATMKVNKNKGVKKQLISKK